MICHLTRSSKVVVVARERRDLLRFMSALMLIVVCCWSFFFSILILNRGMFFLCSLRRAFCFFANSHHFELITYQVVNKLITCLSVVVNDVIPLLAAAAAAARLLLLLFFSLSVGMYFLLSLSRYTTTTIFPLIGEGTKVASSDPKENFCLIGF